MENKFKFSKNNLVSIIKNQYFYYCIEVFTGFFLSLVLSLTVCSINFLYGYLFSLIFVFASILISVFYPKVILKRIDNHKKLKSSIMLFYSANIFILVLILIITIFLKMYNVNEIDIYGILVGIIILVIVLLTIKYFWYKSTIKK